MPGSFCIDASDTFEEPVSWPPIKLIEGGTVRTDVEALFARQSRAALALRMDLRAAIAGIETTRAKIGDLVAQHGAAVVKHVLRATLDSGERLFAERLADIPDGRWSHRVYTEAAVSGDRGTYAYQVNLTKVGQRLVVDNAGTDPQAGAINLTFAAFAGAVLAAITQQMTPDLGGAYGGVYRRVEFRPEPGLLNCADFPAAVSPSGALTTELQLNAAGIAVAKMLSTGSERSRARILGPCIPHFYGPIQAGAGANGVPFIFGNTDGMMGSLGGTPIRDGVDTGGHYWVPDSIAANVEDSEAQYPILFLYRRMLPGGADGAGRHRGGLGVVEGAMPHEAAAFHMLLHENEAFTKGDGLAGANPGSLARFRHSRNTDVHEQLADGRVPVDFDDVCGDEVVTVFKGPPLALGPSDVFEWTSPTTGGYGDPLLRDPQQVADDVADRILTAEVAERVYGVVLRERAVDQVTTAQLRQTMRARRLGGRAPGEPVPAPEGARRVGDILHVVDGRWWCNGADLGSVRENYKIGCVLLEQPARKLAPEFAATDTEIADRFVVREYLCPVTGYRIDCEIAARDEPPLHDITLIL
jgi:N-methylhydantoinase B